MDTTIYGSGIYGGVLPPTTGNVLRGIVRVGRGDELITMTVTETSSSIYDIVSFDLIGFIGRKTL
jgi:hypothetical protein